MPKLIMKQAGDSDSSGFSLKRLWLFAVLLSGLIALVVGAWFFYKPSPPEVEQTLQALPTEIRIEYEKHRYSVEALEVAYNSQTTKKAKTKDKIDSLIAQVKLSLQHLDDMDFLVLDAGLELDAMDQFTELHQYQKDIWQARLHFQELRLSRVNPFGEENMQDHAADNLEAFPEPVVDPSLIKQRMQMAQPVGGMVEGSCSLMAGAAGECKPPVQDENLEVAKDN